MPDLSGAMSAERELDNLIGQAEAQDAQFMEAISLEGSFTDKGMRALVSALEAGLSELGMSGDEAKIGEALLDDGSVSEDLNRALMMVVSPINDAVEAGILDAALSIDLDGIDEDRELTMAASRIRMAFQDREFKRWLSEQVDEPVEEEVVGEESTTSDVDGGDMTDDQVDEFFMSRM